jgi:phosphate transport system permease protein
MLTLGFMLLPLVLITSREAIIAVPREYRDASAALGVSKWETIRSVVLPAAVPGITTGVILGVGRIAGETAPILLTTGGGVLPGRSAAPSVLDGFQLSASPPFVTNPALLEATSALPYQLYALITAGLSGNIEDPQQFAWGLALTLLLAVLLFYAGGIATRYYFRRKLHQ